VKADVWPRGDAANELLLRLLELSRYFMSPQTRAPALAHIKARSFYFRPAKLIEISYEYQTKILFPAAFQHLAMTSLRALRKALQATPKWYPLGVYMPTGINTLKGSQDVGCAHGLLNVGAPMDLAFGLLGGPNLWLLCWVGRAL
jgi:hypothetical protein